MGALMNKNMLFKQNGDIYDMWYIDKEGEHDMGVNFAIPEGTKIEDYPIKIEEFDSSGKREIRPCQNLKVILANPPKITRSSTLTINGFNFIKVGEGTINFSDTNVLSNSIVSAYDKTANLNLSGARLSGSAIHFTQSNDHVYKIKTLIANNSNIDNAAGTFSGTIENAKVETTLHLSQVHLYILI